MKLFLRLALLCVLGLSLPARAAEWMSDLAAAQARAAKEHKPLLLEFTGSAWCPPCKALHARVIETPEFEKFGETVILVALDFPPAKERTPDKIKPGTPLAALMALKEKYDAPGFPTMILFDVNGKETSRIVGYNGDAPKTYLAQLR